MNSRRVLALLAVLSVSLSSAYALTETVQHRDKDKCATAAKEKLVKVADANCERSCRGKGGVCKFVVDKDAITTTDPTGPVSNKYQCSASIDDSKITCECCNFAAFSEDQILSPLDGTTDPVLVINQLSGYFELHGKEHSELP